MTRKVGTHPQNTYNSMQDAIVAFLAVASTHGSNHPLRIMELRHPPPDSATSMKSMESNKTNKHCSTCCLDLLLLLRIYFSVGFICVKYFVLGVFDITLVKHIGLPLVLRYIFFKCTGCIQFVRPSVSNGCFVRL